jgi:hypothetical protein
VQTIIMSERIEVKKSELPDDAFKKVSFSSRVPEESAKAEAPQKPASAKKQLLLRPCLRWPSPADRRS